MWTKSAYPAEKKELYPILLNQFLGLSEGEKDPLPNMANLSALIYSALEDVNWTGFYLLKEGMLVLGPFQGLPACIRIPLGKGVCGTAAAEERTVLVRNVHEFPGHIACDSASNSEIVIPLMKDGRLLGVMDIDSPILSRFDEEDQNGLEQLASILLNGCDW